jgi:ubiquinone/menaquinone biosynthesis C-methylase UbiE
MKKDASKRFFKVAYLRRSRKLFRYVEEKPWVKQFYKDFLELEPGIRIVDLGCGTGEFTRQLARLVSGRCRILGVDSRTVSLKTAVLETRKAKLSAQISYKKGDVSNIPLEDAFADLTCCRSVLMHLRDPLSAVIEMARVTKPGGIVAALEPGLMNSFYDPEDEIFMELDQRMAAESRKGARKLTGKDFAIGERLPGIFQKAGLEQIRVEVLANAWTPCDARLKMNQVKVMVGFWYRLFRDGRVNDRRFLLAAGVPPGKISRYLSLSEKWYRDLLGNAKRLPRRTLVVGSSLFVVVGRKTQGRV